MPLGLPNTADPFYSYKRFQKEPDFDWTETPAIGGNSGYLERNPRAAYVRQMGKWNMPLTGAGAFDDYIQNYVYNQSQAGYGAALAEDPTLKYQSYLDQIGSINDLYRQFMSLSPRQRGVRSQGPTRTIADI